MLWSWSGALCARSDSHVGGDPEPRRLPDEGSPRQCKDMYQSDTDASNPGDMTMSTRLNTLFVWLANSLPSCSSLMRRNRGANLVTDSGADGSRPESGLWTAHCRQDS